MQLEHIQTIQDLGGSGQGWSLLQMTDYLQMTDHFGKYAGCCHMLLDPVCDLHPLISHLVTELLHGLLSPDLLLLRIIA